MKAIRFYVTIGEDRVIRVPLGIEVDLGWAEVIVLQPDEEARKDVSPGEAKQPHLFDRLADAVRRSGIDTTDLPPDLAENHDHYLYGLPKGIDKQ